MASFVDRVSITVKAGNGGNGCVSFHREKFVQNGGPDGGDGGKGGNIVLYADPNMHTLLDFRFHSKYLAENGGDGSANRCHGKRGQDLTIKVPVGTVFLRESDGAVVADMSEPGVSKILLRGIHDFFDRLLCALLAFATAFFKLGHALAQTAGAAGNDGFLAGSAKDASLK